VKSIRPGKTNGEAKVDFCEGSYGHGHAE
jgi:hypothetical protein